MTTDQLRQARIALGQLYDITQHLDNEPPSYVSKAIDSLDHWLEKSPATASIRRQYMAETS